MTRRQVMSKVKSISGLTNDQIKSICGYIGQITEKTDPNITNEITSELEDKKDCFSLDKIIQSKLIVTGNKVGDVIMHGPLRHPVLLLKKSKEEGSWIGVILTSEKNCKDLLMEINYRVRPKNMESFATKTMLVVKENEKYSYKYTITDKSIIKTIKKSLKKAFN